MHKRLHFGAADPEWDAVERQWMTQLQAQGPESWAALGDFCKVYQGAFVRKLVYLGVPVHDAEDATQQAWLELRRKAVAYDGREPVRLFLSGFVMNAARRFHQKEGRHVSRTSSLSDEKVAECMEEALQRVAPGSGNAREWADFLRCVRDMLQALRAKYPRLARMLVLRHVFELSLKEIVEEIGGDPEKAKAELFSARRKALPDARPCDELRPTR